MADEDEYLDSARDWVNEHVRRYIESGGADGHDENGHLCCILTTRGRKSGKLRRTPLIYARDGKRVLVVASKAGNAAHPHWYLNLLEEPDATLQIESEVSEVVARTATPEEKPALWDRMVSVFPDYAKYQEKTDRDIPIVILEPR